MPPFELVDAIDILIVAYVLYKGMMLLRGTRATAIVKGLVVLLLAAAGSRILGFTTVGWLLDQGTTLILVALPVVFYPELRRALEHLGRGAFFSRFGLGSAAIEDIVDTVVQTARGLRRHGWGALIVFEREVGLGEYVESGVRIGGAVSGELLLSIFHPGGPLHDGAVVLRGDQLLAAACFLPLGDSPYLAPDMGSRHRAAVGLTEQSDAVVVVVSEESGAVSIACEGRLEAGLDDALLRERLLEALRPPATHRLRRGEDR